MASRSHPSTRLPLGLGLDCDALHYPRFFPSISLTLFMRCFCKLILPDADPVSVGQGCIGEGLERYPPIEVCYQIYPAPYKCKNKWLWDGSCSVPGLRLPRSSNSACIIWPVCLTAFVQARLAHVLCAFWMPSQPGSLWTTARRPRFQVPQAHAGVVRICSPVASGSHISDSGICVGDRQSRLTSH